MAYFVFTIIWFTFLFLSNKMANTFKKSLVIVIAVAFVYGLLMELCQTMLTSYRTGDWYDVLANTSGIVFAAILLKILEKTIVTFKSKKS